MLNLLPITHSGVKYFDRRIRSKYSCDVSILVLKSITEIIYKYCYNIKCVS